LKRLLAGGAPRSAGYAQGASWREQLPRGRMPAWLRGIRRGDLRSALRRALVSPGSLVALQRDLERHFPHFAERLAGLAHGAGCSSGSLLEALREFSGHAVTPRWQEGGLTAHGFLAPRLAAGVGEGSGRASGPGLDWTVRDLSPAGGLRTLSLAPFWLPAGLAGVNERGLCGVALSFAGDAGPQASSSRAQRDAELPIRAPAWLLLDQCLERCDDVAKALAWCEARPGTGRAHLLFADARGSRGAVTIDGTARRSVDPGSLLDGVTPPDNGGASFRVIPTPAVLWWRGACFGFD
jgi:hypothetical protein